LRKGQILTRKAGLCILYQQNGLFAQV